MPAAALEAEVDQCIAELAGQRDEQGRRLVVRNGRHRARTVTTAAGPVEVTAPRVNDKRVDAGKTRKNVTVYDGADRIVSTEIPSTRAWRCRRSPPSTTRSPATQ